MYNIYLLSQKLYYASPKKEILFNEKYTEYIYARLALELSR